MPGPRLLDPPAPPDAPAHPDAPPVVLGGYRLVRRLAVDDRAEVHLAVPATGREGAGPVAIKCARPGVAHRDVLAEADALWRARGAHAVALLDAIDRGPLPPALVLERLPGSLPGLLARCGALGTPAAATVIAPLAAALGRMHAAGVAYGGIRAASVTLDAGGAPVLVGFGSAARFPAGASRAALAGVAEAVEDALGLRRLAIGLLERPDPARRALLAVLEAPDAQDAIREDPAEWIAGLERAVFAAVEPVPLPSVRPMADEGLAGGGMLVRGSAVGGSAVEARPARLGAQSREASREAPAGEPAPESAGRASSRPVAALATRAGARGRRARPREPRVLGGLTTALAGVGDRAIGWALARLPVGAADALAAAPGRIAQRTRSARVRSGPVRARVWVPAAAVGVALVAAIALVPPGGPGPALAEPGPASDPAAASGEAESRPGDDAVVPTAGAPEPAGGSETAGEVGSAGDPELGGDPGAAGAVGGVEAAGDPESAAAPLVAARAACLALRDPGCLSVVLQPGSPAEAADRAAIAAAGSGTAPVGADWRPRSAVLVDLLGGAALVEVTVETAAGTGTAPVLLVRTGAGWRIRAVLADASAAAEGASP